MTWLSVALTLLKMAASIVDYLNSKKLLDAGADKEVAKASLAILNKTKFAKETMERVNDMSGTAVDDLLSQLGKPDNR